MFEAADVIDDDSASAESNFGDGAFGGIDREGEGGVSVTEEEEGLDASDFFVSGDWNETGAGALAADVEYMSAGMSHSGNTGGDGFWSGGAEAVAAEGIGSGVEDCHDLGGLTERDLEMTALPMSRNGVVHLRHLLCREGGSVGGFFAKPGEDGGEVGGKIGSEGELLAGCGMTELEEMGVEELPA